MQVVKQQLGHRSIATTEKRLQTLPDADETALAALHHVRSTAAGGVMQDGYRQLIREHVLDKCWLLTDR